ncbi:hypothetical protein [Cecembia sp.]|uniref:hypothetical protein n=1 Tax=Cecembia sp. TaxID=1898110 RepID=UPI0025BBE06A|nr:hypothetical protein [Cecembia sp.]
MKKLVSFYLTMLLVVSLGVFTSCGEKDEPVLSPIIGVWNYSALDVDIFINGQPMVQFFEALGATSEEAQQAADEIRNDFFSNEDFAGTVLEFKVDDTYEIRIDGRLDESGTWELLNGNSLLRLTSGEDITDFDVRRLTNNQLTIFLEEEESEDFFGIGLPVLVKLQLELSFVK